MESILMVIIKMHNNKAMPGRDNRMNLISKDNGGRRKIEDRRQFVYTFYIPERRSGSDRRACEDRRQSHRVVEPNL